MGDLPNGLVAGRVSEAVVDRFEVVQISDDDRQGQVIALGAVNLLMQHLIKGQFVKINLRLSKT